MNPRNLSKATSKASWTSLPEEFAFKVLSALEKEFPEQSKVGEFITEGKIFDSEILVRIGYLENGRLRQINFEASLDYDRERTEDIIENFYICIDALAGWMHQYFEQVAKDEDVDLPLVWRASDFKNNTVFFQYSTVNSRLEQEADRLLGTLANDLFNEDLPSEDAFEHAVVDPDLSKDKQDASH